MKALFIGIALSALAACSTGSGTAYTDDAIDSLRVVRVANTEVCLVVVARDKALAMQVLPCQVMDGVQVMVVTP